MPGERERVLFTNREIILSSDVTRIGKLVNKETQNREEALSRRADFYFGNTFDDISSGSKGAAATATPGLIVAPSIDPVAGTYNVTLGAGEGECVGAGTIPADESEFQLARWAQQVIPWPEAGYPNPSNPKICLIVATPADVADDLQSRNILVNPDTREVSPANVYKLSRPEATISVLVGTAAATPAPPACPAGTLPLFEVIIPAGATDSANYLFVRRSWRRVEFPGSSQHGIVKGCVPNLMDETFIGIPDGGHRIVIDGELLSWSHTQTLVPAVDSSGNPGTAPATYDLPSYLYLCGGRWSPSRSQGVSPVPDGGGTYAPVVLVESTTPPDAFGYPTAALVAGGVTLPKAACCYIGTRFRAAGTTNNVPAIYDGDWIHFQAMGITDAPLFCAKNPTVVTSGAYTAVTLSSLPAVSTAGIVAGYQDTISGGGISLTKFAAGGGSDAYMFASVATTVGDSELVSPKTTLGRSRLLSLYAASSAGAGVRIGILATAYNMNVPRLAR